MKIKSVLISTVLVAIAATPMYGCSKSDQMSEDVAAIRKIKEKEQADKEAAIAKGLESQKRRQEELAKLPRN
jgi:hypothetical protein